eukprot:CAMPEP_0194266368 /NCGR_PEP_ID=MMETSP0169-20130528/1299_1 /TAXON_ID=218684 /ORGANISM="Corethron pennatum, Strain L29A3" /LENGTH=186 /DNA_ID=CAMNT_0039007035 /DNA_START=64 /DNA_END=624 /DNA_ORIENTATION=+
MLRITVFRLPSKALRVGPLRPGVSIIAPPIREFSASPTTEDASPTVGDRIINITFVDHTGHRATFPSRWGAGRSLFDAAFDAGVDLGPSPSVGLPYYNYRSETWREPVFGEGAGSGIDHVLLPGKWYSLVEEEGYPKSEGENDALQQYWDDEDLTESSRLASQIILTPNMEGINVFIPDGVAHDCF